MLRSLRLLVSKSSKNLQSRCRPVVATTVHGTRSFSEKVADEDLWEKVLRPRVLAIKDKIDAERAKQRAILASRPLADPPLDEHLLKSAFSVIKPSLVHLIVPREHQGRFYYSMDIGTIVSSDGKTILTPARFLASDKELYTPGIPKAACTQKLLVALQDGHVHFEAVPVHVDFHSGFAILKIVSPKPSSLPKAKITSSFKLLPGDQVVAVGIDRYIPTHPPYAAETCTIKGVVCSNHLHTGRDFRIIQSSSFLVNLDGELVGLNTLRSCDAADGLSTVLLIDPMLNSLNNPRVPMDEEDEEI